MLRFIVLLCVIAFALPGPTFAGCGCDQCPVDETTPWEPSRLFLEITHQYIDQDQPRIGTAAAAVGEIESHHDEIRSINRQTTFRAVYKFGSGAWAATAVLPYVSRYHEHIERHHHDAGGGTTTEETHHQRFSYRGFADLETQIRRLWRPRGSSTVYGLSVGVKAPTGENGIVNDEGDPLEPSANPGTGSWDFSAGGTVEWRLAAPGRTGSPDPVSVRASVGGRLFGKGTEDYRYGPEIQAHLGAAYPAWSVVDLLLQTNLRVRGKDDVGSTDEDKGNTGGTSVYLTPGLRVELAPRTSLVTLLQIPVYQDVNGIQIVSGSNLFVGISRSIL